MDFNFYQREAKKTAIYKGAGTFMGLAYTALGLNGEAGEFAEKVKKCWRDDEGIFIEGRLADIKKELGDILWYLSAAANEVGLTLDEIAIHNLEKLKARVKDGTIHGSGDNR